MATKKPRDIERSGSLEEVVLLVLGLALASACAAGNPYDDEGPAEVEVTVTNERQSVVSAYVQWEGASPTRLGEVGGGSSIVTRIPMRGQQMRVFFVGPGQGPGDPAEPEYASARAGDRFQWILRSDRSILYLRY
jgi:hypothetical protein